MFNGLPMFTKQQMEDYWNSQHIGYLKDFNKGRRSKTRKTFFKVKIMSVMIHEKPFESDIVDIVAKDYFEAQRLAVKTKQAEELHKRALKHRMDNDIESFKIIARPDHDPENIKGN